MLVSTQHSEGLDADTMIKPDIIEQVLRPILPRDLYDEKRLEEREFVYVNPTGKFVLGGPMGDTGLTGRKIIVDTYGGAARHGGGAFSGKDPTKVDRSAAYAARYVAKNLVAAELADRIEVNVAYAIGVAHPVSIAVRTFGTEREGISVARIEELVTEHFDLRPGAIIRDLDLQRPIYSKTAAYGHFGRDDHDFTWERTDKAAQACEPQPSSTVSLPLTAPDRDPRVGAVFFMHEPESSEARHSLRRTPCAMRSSSSRARRSRRALLIGVLPPCRWAGATARPSSRRRPSAVAHPDDADDALPPQRRAARPLHLHRLLPRRVEAARRLAQRYSDRRKSSESSGARRRRQVAYRAGRCTPSRTASPVT